MLNNALILALGVLFLHVTTWKGMIWQVVSQKLKHLPWYIKKPLYDCPICMAPWWGSLILVGFGLTINAWPENFYIWVLEVFIAGGINAVLIYIIGAGKAISKHFKDAEAK